MSLSGVHDRYRGTFCSECGWDASYQPPEVTSCISCDGELVNRFTADSYEYFGSLVDKPTAGGIPVPLPQVAVALASIAAHVEEFNGGEGATEDIVAATSLCSDPGVVAYLDLLRPLALLPVAR